MAVLFSASTQGITTTRLPAPLTKFTYMAWVYGHDWPAGGFGIPLQVGPDSAAACSQVYTYHPNTTTYKFALWNGTEFEQDADVTRTTNIWYHIAMTLGSSLQLYVDGKFVTSIVARTPSAQGLRIGTSSDGNFWNGRVAAAKFFSGLTMGPSEIRREMAQYNRAQKTVLHGCWPLTSIRNLEDKAIGGAIGPLAWSTSPATATGPPIPWEVPPKPKGILIAAAGGGSFQAAWARGANSIISPGAYT